MKIIIILLILLSCQIFGDVNFTDEEYNSFQLQVERIIERTCQKAVKEATIPLLLRIDQLETQNYQQQEQIDEIKKNTLYFIIIFSVSFFAAGLTVGIVFE